MFSVMTWIVAVRVLFLYGVSPMMCSCCYTRGRPRKVFVVVLRAVDGRVGLACMGEYGTKSGVFSQQRNKCERNAQYATRIQTRSPIPAPPQPPPLLEFHRIPAILFRLMGLIGCKPSGRSLAAAAAAAAGSGSAGASYLESLRWDGLLLEIGTYCGKYAGAPSFSRFGKLGT